MSRKKKNYLKQTGLTTDGKSVYSGTYRMCETVGLPLDVLFSCLKEKNALPDWIDFYQTAQQAGMEHDRIISKLEEAISDSFGKDFSDRVIFTLDKIFNFKE